MRVSTHVHEPGVAQHLEVTRHAGLVHADRLDQLTDGSFATAHGIEDAPARRLGDHFEDGGLESHADNIRDSAYMCKCMFKRSAAPVRTIEV